MNAYNWMRRIHESDWRNEVKTLAIDNYNIVPSQTVES